MVKLLASRLQIQINCHTYRLLLRYEVVIFPITSLTMDDYIHGRNSRNIHTPMENYLQVFLQNMFHCNYIIKLGSFDYVLF